MHRANREEHDGLKTAAREFNGWKRDLSSERKLAIDARLMFKQCICVGEERVDLMAVALAVEAEDDALTSNGSLVPLPTLAFKKRIERFANDVQAIVRNKHGDSEDVTMHAVAAAERYLYQHLHFRLPQHIDFVETQHDDNGGRMYQVDDSGTDKPTMSTVFDHPGVYLIPDHAYVSRVLTKKIGCPAVLAIILDALIRELARRGVVRKIVRVELEGNSLPYCDVLPLSSSSKLNATPSDSAILLLLHLKMCFWPFGWDTGKKMRKGTINNGEDDTSMMEILGSGFTAAARSALNLCKGRAQGVDNAYLEAIGRAAAHRLKRGIWTTTGGGDIKRCIAACERLLLLHESGNVLGVCNKIDGFIAMRDLSTLYLHEGRFDESTNLLLKCYEYLTGLDDITCIAESDAFHDDTDIDTVLLKELIECSSQAASSIESHLDESSDVKTPGNNKNLSDDKHFTELPW